MSDTDILVKRMKTQGCLLSQTQLISWPNPLLFTKWICCPCRSLRLHWTALWSLCGNLTQSGKIWSCLSCLRSCRFAHNILSYSWNNLTDYRVQAQGPLDQNLDLRLVSFAYLVFFRVVYVVVSASYSYI